MNCERIRELLSEYIDNALDAQAKSSVEEHLKECRRCPEELASLKAYREKMGSLKDIKAPEGFLKAVHERLERRSEFEKIMRKIFVPIHIKVPMEALAVAASVLLIITIYRGTGKRPLTEMAQAPIFAERRVVAKRRAEKPAIPEDLDAKNKLAKVIFAVPEAEEEKEIPAELAREAEVAVGKTAEGQKPVEAVALLGAVVVDETLDELFKEKIESQPIELALLIRPKIYKAEYAQEAIGEAKKADTEKAYSKCLDVARDRRQEVVTRSPILKDDSLVTTAAEEKKGPSRQTLIRALEELKNLIEAVKGRLVDIEYDKDANLPQYVTAEIPSKIYPSFVKRLAEIGSVTGLPEEGPPHEIPQLIVKIKVTASE